MDFGVLPPDVNSGRMYAGPGSDSMLAAAAAWDDLAAELSTAATSYGQVISALTVEPWVGPASSAMAAAAAPYVSWLAAAAALARQTAAQARTAAAAFESAFAMTVPPTLVATNRSQLTLLVATNILGQNTAAIEAIQAEYAEMWAQDAAAMYGYAGVSAAASELTPFPPPTQNTEPGGPAAQAAAVARAAGEATDTQAETVAEMFPGSVLNGSSAMSTPSDPLASGLTSLAPNVNLPLSASALQISTPIGDLDAVALYIAAAATGSLALAITNTTRPWQSPGSCNGTGNGTSDGGGVSPTQGNTVNSTEALGAVGPGGTTGPVYAGVGHASMVGALSVPHGWTTAAPEIQLAVEALPSVSPVTDSTSFDGNAASLLSGMALANWAARATGSSTGNRKNTDAPAQPERKPTVVVIQKPPAP
ncbi:PPE family protein [Mycobacterium sp. 050128]|uniref:PPE family protein n=1 Tax=Mycobacterium sp. 050128 TaxID=3096112 RepID=UPI002ED7CE70